MPESGVSHLAMSTLKRKTTSLAWARCYDVTDKQCTYPPARDLRLAPPRFVRVRDLASPLSSRPRTTLRKRASMRALVTLFVSLAAVLLFADEVQGLSKREPSRAGSLLKRQEQRSHRPWYVQRPVPPIRIFTDDQVSPAVTGAAASSRLWQSSSRALAHAAPTRLVQPSTSLPAPRATPQ